MPEEKEGKVDEEQLNKMEKSALPEPMREMTAVQKKHYVESKSKARKKIKQEIQKLSESRDAYIAKEKRKQVAAAPSMSDALTKAIKKQAKEKDYQFEK